MVWVCGPHRHFNSVFQVFMLKHPDGARLEPLRLYACGPQDGCSFQFCRPHRVRDPVARK
jgi:hypothetical protein